MQEQIFSMVVECAGKVSVSTDSVRDWLKGVLAGKVDRCTGMVAENFGTTALGSMTEYSLYIINKDNVSAEAMKSYFADTPATFKITELSKRKST